MIDAVAEFGPGRFHLTITGHAAADEATCASVTAIEQTVLMFLEHLAALRPEHIQFSTTPAMEARNDCSA